MSRTKKEIRNTTWIWVIGTLVVLGLIWWWASASIEEGREEEMRETEEVEREEVETSHLRELPENKPQVLMVRDFLEA